MAGARSPGGQRTLRVKSTAGGQRFVRHTARSGQTILLALLLRA